ncbi:rnd efflux pump membrane fusion protein barrel-sandwich domain [Lucifera butyrica]|uniref:Rnd efflux pump membrane fusion protein barrel-sandwich domain n=1 Tax=Lucifera butyrica TaxID=1351585 RepID=A0A498REH7_9FIRM|nr:HlyD family secretion protein [Lucifera butyrica]VBB09891.1 rnd efflux pump membrane fusion protein barrel-sandwich domain [Lucifera butyrica]
MSETKPKLSKKATFLIISLVLLVFIAGGIWWWYRASRIVSTDDARVKGTIVAISPKEMGRMAKVFVKEGDPVKAGQILAQLEKSDYEVQLENAKAALAAAKANLAKLKAGNRPQEIGQAQASVTQMKADYENAQKNYERGLALYRDGAISSQQRDSLATALSVAKAQYDSARQSYSLSVEGPRTEDISAAEAQVEQAEAAVKNDQLQLDNTDIKAPVDGVIGLKSVEEGEIVVAGQPIFSLANLSDVWVEADIEETYVGKVKAGQPVDFTVDAYPGKTFKGKVLEVGPATGSEYALLPADNAAGNFTKVTQRLPVKIIASPEENGVLKPGMSVIVEIHIR